MGVAADEVPGPAGWPPAAPAILLAGAAFSLAIFFNFGYQAGGSFAFAGLGVAALVAGVIVQQRSPLQHGPLAGALLAWFAVVTALAASDEPWSMFVHFAPHAWQPAWARVLFIVALGLVAAGTVRDPRWASVVRLAILGVAFLLAATWTIDQSPTPGIDVWHMHTEAAQRLLHGHNPYSLAFANPYGPGVIDFYAYPPVTLLVQTASYVVLGDVRYASVGGILVAAGCARLLARQAGLPRFAADAAAAILLLQGRPFYMVEQGWTEPVVAGLAGLAALAWARRSQTGPVAVALALASKQFLWVYLPALAFARLTGRELARATLVLAAVFLPFFLWGPAAFWRGVVISHFDGSAVNIAYPDVQPGDPWPNSDTVAVNLLQYHVDWQWPLWVGIALWLATAAAFVGARQRDVGTLFVTAAAGVACAGYFGSAFHPNYIWLVPVLGLLGVLAHRARQDAPAPTAGPETFAIEPPVA